MSENIVLTNQNVSKETYKVPAEKRVLVTINQMAKILGIGHNTIRRLVRENPNAEYICWVGTRAYLKREMFANTILEQNAI